MGTGVGEPHAGVGVLMELPQVIEVVVRVVEERVVEESPPVLRHHLVVGDLGRLDPPGGGDPCARCGRIGFVVGFAGERVELVPAAGDRRDEVAPDGGHLGRERGTHVGPGEFLETLVFGQLTDEAPGGAEHERVDGGRPRFEDADRPARHLGEDVEPVGLGLLDQPEVLSP